MGAVFFLVTGYFTWRSLRISESSTRNTVETNHETLRLSLEGQITDRFSRAIEHLGHQSPEIQLGGIYALERIAKDSPRDYWAIIEILTSFVQSQSSITRTPLTPIQIGVQSVITVITRRDHLKETDDRRLMLNRCNLWGMQAPNANLSRANLSESILREANLNQAILSKVNLSDADLTEATLWKATMPRYKLVRAKLNTVNLSGAELSKADLSEAQLNDALLGEAIFKDATLNRAVLKGASLAKTNFTGASLKDTDLKGTDLSRAIGLTREQIAQAITDSTTILPSNI